MTIILQPRGGTPTRHCSRVAAAVAIVIVLIDSSELIGSASIDMPVIAATVIITAMIRGPSRAEY